jgi:hypothetical protein
MVRICLSALHLQEIESFIIFNNSYSFLFAWPVGYFDLTYLQVAIYLARCAGKQMTRTVSHAKSILTQRKEKKCKSTGQRK